LIRATLLQIFTTVFFGAIEKGSMADIV